MFSDFSLPGFKLETKREALNWLVAEVRDLGVWRAELDAKCADPAAKVVDLRRDFWRFLVRQGKVAGAAMALTRTGWLTDEQYVGFITQANETLHGLSERAYG